MSMALCSSNLTRQYCVSAVSLSNNQTGQFEPSIPVYFSINFTIQHEPWDLDVEFHHSYWPMIVMWMCIASSLNNDDHLLASGWMDAPGPMSSEIGVRINWGSACTE